MMFGHDPDGDSLLWAALAVLSILLPLFLV